jgi:hypothetical protein
VAQLLAAPIAQLPEMPEAAPVTSAGALREFGTAVPGYCIQTSEPTDHAAQEAFAAQEARHVSAMSMLMFLSTAALLSRRTPCCNENGKEKKKESLSDSCLEGFVAVRVNAAAGMALASMFPSRHWLRPNSLSCIGFSTGSFGTSLLNGCRPLNSMLCTPANPAGGCVRSKVRKLSSTSTPKVASIS